MLSKVSKGGMYIAIDPTLYIPISNFHFLFHYWFLIFFFFARSTGDSPKWMDFHWLTAEFNVLMNSCLAVSCYALLCFAFVYSVSICFVLFCFVLILIFKLFIFVHFCDCNLREHQSESGTPRREWKRKWLERGAQKKNNF